MRTIGLALALALVTLEARASEVSLDNGAVHHDVLVADANASVWHRVCALSCQLALGEHYRLVSPAITPAVALTPQEIAPQLLIHVTYARHRYVTAPLVGVGLGVAGTLVGTTLLANSAAQPGVKTETAKGLEALDACSAASGVVVAALSGYAIAHGHTDVGVVAAAEP